VRKAFHPVITASSCSDVGSHHVSRNDELVAGVPFLTGSQRLLGKKTNCVVVCAGRWDAGQRKQELVHSENSYRISEQ